jgi:hypothetical protein
MPDPATRFIALATRPLDGAARELAAVELAARIAHGGGEDDVLREAITRLEPASVSPPSRWPWSLTVAVAALAAVLAVLLPRHWQEARLLEGIHLQGRDGRFPERVLAAMGPAAADVPLRTHRYKDAAVWLDEVEKLLQEDPKDPSRYWLYFARFGVHHSVLLPDFEMRWKELDPDNALWPLRAAGILSQSAVSQSGRGVRVINEPVFEQALSFLHQAASCNHVRLLTAGIQERQLRGYTFNGSLAGIYMRYDLLQRASSEGGLESYFLSRALLAKAERCESENDLEGLKVLTHDLRRVHLLMWSNPNVDLGSTLMITHGCRVPLAAICRRMGLNDEAERFDRLVDIDVEIHKKRLASKAMDPSRHAASLESRQGNYLGIVPSADASKPGRLAEYAVADRFTALAGVLAAFLVAAGGLIEVLRRGALPRGLAAGLMPLFRASDRAWLFGLGLLFPAAWWFGITWYSPLGCRDIALSFFKRNGFPMMQPWLSQGLGGLVLAFVMLVQTARWRLGKRGGFLALRPRGMWIGWSMAVLAALYIPAMGIVRYLPGHEEKFLLYGSAAGGIALLWLLWQAAMGLCAARGNALGGQVMLRLLMPAVIALALLLLAAMPLLRKSERHWVAEIGDFSRTSRAIPPSAAEQRQLEEARKMLLEALE